MLRSIGLEIAAKAGIHAVQTAADGTAWVQLPDVPCNQVALYNDSGTGLDVRYCSNAGAARPGESSLSVPAGIVQPLRGITDARQVQIKRTDASNTQLTVKFIVEAV